MTLVNVYDCGRSWSRAISIYHVIRMLSWQEGGEQLGCVGRQVEGWASPGHSRLDASPTGTGVLGGVVAELPSVRGGHTDSLNPEQLCLQPDAFSSGIQQAEARRGRM